MNTYGYTFQNPTKFIDRDGRFAFLAVAPAFFGGGSAAAGGATFGSFAGAATFFGSAGLAGYYFNKYFSDSDLQQEIEREANRREYKNICKEPPPPGLDPCELAKWKLRKALICRAARKENTNRWWGGVDDQHSDQLAQDLDRAVQNAEAAVKRNCKCS